MNKFLNNKRKSLNKESARLRYLYAKNLHLHFILHRVKSFRRKLKIHDQIVKILIQIRTSIIQFELIKSQSIPKFPSGGVYPKVWIEESSQFTEKQFYYLKNRKPLIIGSGIGAVRLCFGMDKAVINKDRSVITVHTSNGLLDIKNTDDTSIEEIIQELKKSKMILKSDK